MKKIALQNLPSWNLSDLYATVDDPAIERDFQKNVIDAIQFSKLYKGRVKDDLSDESLSILLKKYESLIQNAVKPYIYAHLLFAADTKNPLNGALMQKAQEKYSAIINSLLFVDLELIALDEEVLKQCIASPLLASYAQYLKKLLKEKPHRLTEMEERILNDKSLTSSAAFSRLFDEELSQKHFAVRIGRIWKKEKQYTEAEALDMLYSPDRAKRKAAADGITKGLKEEARRLTFVFNIIGQDKAINDRYTKFNLPEDSRHLGNGVSKEVVDCLTESVIDSYPVVQDFYRFKKEILGYKTLYEYDRYAPIGATEKKFSFDEAKQIILNAFGKFSVDYRNYAESFFANRHIDAAPREGKRSGAFCSSFAPGHQPYILLNYTGVIKEVLTMAHELGHGVHSLFADKQNFFNYDAPLVLCETASVFGEMLVFDDLKTMLTGKEKFALYMHKIESIFATVFRQIAMYTFEQDFHA
ncbi:MAG: oligoendopeptidase F, partial [Parcubacteria group bacterium]|nr:oligoendopeptidase F [Parcubacteria group bacterium]